MAAASGAGGLHTDSSNFPECVRCPLPPLGASGFVHVSGGCQWLVKKQTHGPAPLDVQKRWRSSESLLGGALFALKFYKDPEGKTIALSHLTFVQKRRL